MGPLPGTSGVRARVPRCRGHRLQHGLRAPGHVVSRSTRSERQRPSPGQHAASLEPFMISSRTTVVARSSAYGSPDTQDNRRGSARRPAPPRAAGRRRRRDPLITQEEQIARRAAGTRGDRLPAVPEAAHGPVPPGRSSPSRRRLTPTTPGAGRRLSGQPADRGPTGHLCWPACRFGSGPWAMRWHRDRPYSLPPRAAPHPGRQGTRIFCGDAPHGLTPGRHRLVHSHKEGHPR